MLSKNKIALINSLKSKKGRLKNNLFIAEGSKLFDEMLHSSFKTKFVFGKKDWLSKIENHHENSECEYFHIEENEMKKVSSLTSPQEVLALVEIPKFKYEHSEIEKELSLVLDRVQDPGNLGTIIRIADWYGIKNIFCSEDTVDAFNPKVIQATMGSIARVKAHYVDIISFLKNNPNGSNFPIYGSFLDGLNIYKTKLENHGLIVLGSESHGISQEILPFISGKITIPSFNDTLNRPESLNVAIATGIICSEFRRNLMIYD